MEDGVYYIRDFTTDIWNGKSFERTSILKSPFYLSLVKNSKKIYDDYRDLFHTTRRKNRICSYEDFIDLMESIKNNGFSNSSTLTHWKSRREIRLKDGQHRASILLFLDNNAKVKKNGNKLYPISSEERNIEKEINGKRIPELHTIIAWDGNKNEESVREYVENKLAKNFEIVYQKLIELDDNTQKKLANSIYFTNKSRVIDGSIYLVVVKDTNPIYELKKATSCEQVLNVNMKFVKEDMRLKIGGSRKAYHSIHTSYNQEETLMVLVPLNLQHLVDRPKFENFGELFDMLNHDENLEYVVQRSFDELKNPPSFFRIKDVDILVNDYYYFKSITGARSVNKKLMRENDNGYHIQSKIHIGGREVPFDIRFVGDDFVDSLWEQDMLNKRILHSVTDEIQIYIPNKEDELYSLLYNILVQKPNSKNSKHIPRVNELTTELGLKILEFETNIESVWGELKKYMERNGYKFKKPNDRRVGFNIK